jgi:hypothetical protein
MKPLALISAIGVALTAAPGIGFADEKLEGKDRRSQSPLMSSAPLDNR